MFAFDTTYLSRLILRGLATATALFSISSVAAEAVSHDPLVKALDQTVPAALDTFNTPGLAVAVVSSEGLILAKGYGNRVVGTDSPVNGDTYFRIASTTKAFTAASVAQLVQDERMRWSDKVIQHLPEFVMHDPYVTREMTVLDLLTHRSGLGSGAGDSMLWPEPSGFSREEIIYNVRFLTPKSSFRGQYGYSNVMYITAAEIVSRMTQQPWEQTVKERIFQPLDMQCFAGDVPANVLENTAKPYGHNDERGIYAIPRNAIDERGLASAAAGGIVCNASGMAKWLQYLLSQYATLNEETQDTAAISDADDTVLSPDTVAELWYPRTVLGIGKLEKKLDGTVLKAYGLGWRISNLYQHKVISHTGTLSGFQAYVAMLPDLDIGVVVLNNGSNYGARSSVMQTALRHFLPEPMQQDWVSIYHEYQQQRNAERAARYKAPRGTDTVNNPTERYLGQYVDQWYGAVSISQVGKDVRFSSAKMPMLTGTLSPFRDNSWLIEWDNQNAASNAFIHFNVDVSGNVTGFHLHPFSLETSENHEWSDLEFVKEVEPKPSF